ncbi:tetratricopeptide repeat protein [Noviherbaspirillum malthae]|uniref:tetratricopeptide repeat protein n=1 Tax=Noviherbaspirillum malthae TaxID=1260987 RepID=UPI0018906C6E|nr:tetratricopeptide repeat protein [Noviherbaspirillum malthae]
MKTLAWFIAATLPLTPAAWSADDLISHQMADEARMWQQKDRDDLAATIWRKLLSTQPLHPQALVQLGLIEAQSGDLKQAEALHARASRLSPPPPGLAGLAKAIEARKMPASARERAIAAATAPRAAALPSPAPVAPAAATPVPAPAPAAAPAASAAPASRPSTPVDKAAAPAATSSAKPGPAPVAPPARADEAKPPATQVPARAAIKPADGASAAAMAAGNAGTHLPLPTQPSSADAANDKWSQTRQTLEELVRRQGEPRHLFALARHLTYRDATRREGIRQLAALPDDMHKNTDTRAAWRDALLALTPRQGDAALYSDYLKRYPDDDIVDNRGRGLPMQPATGGPGQASGPRVAAPAVRDDSPQRAEAARLMREAMVDERSGSVGAAARRLEQALLLDPANPSIRIHLARHYDTMGALDTAADLLDGVLADNPTQSDALQVRAQLFVKKEHWYEGLQLLERVPVEMRTPELVRLQRQLWAGAQVARASQAWARGETRQATQWLEQVEARVQGDQAILPMVARAWTVCGQPGRGVRIMRDMVSRSTSSPVHLRVQYAELLLLDRQDAELSAVLRGLAGGGTLTGTLQERVNEVILAYTLRLAETLRETARVNEAAAMLLPVLQRTDDQRVLLAMARVHKAAGEPARALALVEKAISVATEDLGLRLFASELAVAAKQVDAAVRHADAAQRLAPQHPRVLSALGRAERARGDTAKAANYFGQSYALEYDPPLLPNQTSPFLLRLLAHEARPGSLLPLPAGASGLLPIPDALPSVPPAAPTGARRPGSAQGVPVSPSVSVPAGTGSDPARSASYALAAHPGPLAGPHRVVPGSLPAAGKTSRAVAAVAVRLATTSSMRRPTQSLPVGGASHTNVDMRHDKWPTMSFAWLGRVQPE